MICNNPQCFGRKDTVLSPHDLAFLLIKSKKITKLNSNQLNIKKNKIDEDNFGKKYYKKENTKETGKKSCEEKLYQSIVFCEEKLVFTCNCNS
jgi:hypothetical protein